METSKKINVLDESLRLAWLENSKEADSNVSDKDLKIILKGVYNSSMSQEKKQLLIDKLFSKLSSLSLGQLISDSIELKSLSDDDVAIQTNLPVNIIEELKTDAIFPNNIPVILFKDLLKILDISFQTAEHAVWKTFDIIKNRAFLSRQDFKQAQPAFRHNQNSSHESFIKINSISDGRELFENEDSLKKYLQKLDTLMKK